MKRDKEESKVSSEDEGESKIAIKTFREREFLTETKYSAIYQNSIPNKHYKSIDADESRVFCGRFTSRGNLYYCSTQRLINVYDSRDPFNWSLRSTIEA